jgi:hypothetical protein
VKIRIDSMPVERAHTRYATACPGAFPYGGDGA